MSVIDVVAPIKEVRVKTRTSEWFDGEVVEPIKERVKLFTIFKKSKLLIDKELFNASRNRIQSLIKIR